MKKKLISFLVILGLAAGMTGCGSEGQTTGGQTTEEQTTEEALQTIRLGLMTGNTDHWLAVVGEEKGIFEKYGIQIEVTEFAAGINTVDAITTDQVDIGMLADYAAVNRLGNTQDSTDLRLIANFASSSVSKLYVNPQEVTTLEDLAGKGVVTLPGTVWDYWTAKTFEKAGISEEDQVLVNVDSAQAALGVMTTGEGVAFWASGTNATKLEEAGMTALIDMEDLGLRTDSYIVAEESYVKENEELVANYLKALKETEEWVLENQQEAAGIVEEKTGIPQEQFLENLEAVSLLMEFEQDTIDHLTSIKDWALEAGCFEKDFDIEDYIDTTALQKGDL